MYPCYLITLSKDVAPLGVSQDHPVHTAVLDHRRAGRRDYHTVNINQNSTNSIVMDVFSLPDWVWHSLYIQEMETATLMSHSEDSTLAFLAVAILDFVVLKSGRRHTLLL